MSTLASCNSGSLSGYVINALINATKNLESTCGSTTITTPLTVDGLLTANNGIAVTGGLNVDTLGTTGDIVSGGSMIANIGFNTPGEVYANTVSAVSGITGTLLTSNQPNVKSLGTLTALNCSGDITGVNQSLSGVLSAAEITVPRVIKTNEAIMTLYNSSQTIPTSGWAWLEMKGLYARNVGTTTSGTDWVNTSLGITHIKSLGRFVNTSTKNVVVNVDCNVIFGSWTVDGKPFRVRIGHYFPPATQYRLYAISAPRYAYIADGPMFIPATAHISLDPNEFFQIEVFYQAPTVGATATTQPSGTPEVTSVQITRN